jgi:hypothetical protein
MRMLQTVLLALGVCGCAFGLPPIAPEIDPGSGANALALLGGAVLVVRSWRRK